MLDGPVAGLGVDPGDGDATCGLIEDCDVSGCFGGGGWVW